MAYTSDRLNAGEQILINTHHHWQVLVVPGFAGAIGLAVAAFAFIADGRLAFAGAIAAAAAVAWCAWHVVAYKRTFFVVTDRRVIYRHGILTRAGIEIPVDRVANIIFSQSIIERIIRSGDLIIESAGESGQQDFSNIPDPESVQNAIYQAMEAARDGDRPNATSHVSVADEIHKLDALRVAGLLTDDEFANAKTRLLT